MQNKKNTKGFTLIELMIVVGIMAILAAVGYPGYNNYVLRGKRSEGRSALLDTAARLERFYSDNSKYATADDTFPALTNFSTTTETGKYTLSITTSDPYQSFILSATPANFTDDDCGVLKLNSNGSRASDGVDSTCWGK